MAAESNDSSNNNLTQDQVKEILRLANIIYFRSKVYDHTYWMGIKTAKCPMDMWTYQEILFETKPDLIIETGTLSGGSALYFAQMLDMIGKGKVITIDINARKNLPAHPRIKYYTGSSISDITLKFVDEEVKDCASVLVILDADHKADFKLKEMNLYKEYVTNGNYLIAEDSCFDHYPAWPEYGPGPATAIKKFIKENKAFEIDLTKEKHMISFAPRGFLKKLI